MAIRPFFFFSFFFFTLCLESMSKGKFYLRVNVNLSWLTTKRVKPRQMGIRVLVVEIDSLCVTQLLNRKSFNATLSLVNEILGLLFRDWQVSVHYVYCEANFATDFMSNHALTLPIGFHHFVTPLLGVET